jgi:hypothetical protein
VQPQGFSRRLVKNERMKKVYLLTIFALILVSGFSQKNTLQFSAVDKIDVFGPFDVELIKSDKEYAEIEYNQVEKEDIVFEARKGELRLKIKNRHYFQEWKNDTHRSWKYVRVKVYYKDIDVIEAAAGAIVRSHEQIKSKYLNITCTMGAEVTLDVYAKKIMVTSKMGGELEMSGQTENLEVSANSGGVFNAPRLESKIAYVRASMGAEVLVNATEEIEATAGFGANIEYVGGPTVRHTSRNFGGEVNRRGR